jgi:hypothetical protein
VSGLAVTCRKVPQTQIWAAVQCTTDRDLSLFSEVTPGECRAHTGIDASSPITLFYSRPASNSMPHTFAVNETDLKKEHRTSRSTDSYFVFVRSQVQISARKLDILRFSSSTSVPPRKMHYSNLNLTTTASFYIFQLATH